MRLRTTRNKRHAALAVIGLGVIEASVFTLAVMNLTPGHLGFPDDDGCACFVAYTTFPSLPAYE
jgi:hypothetical protein